MPSCLGLYIQDNLIKYAKISKERNDFKIEAYGVKFYESDIEKTIEQIVKETFSYQIPLSVNINKEHYTYSNVFNLLKPHDLEKAIETEFEFFCNNNNKNKNTIEFRRLKTINLEDRDKMRVIYAYIDKANIVERLQLLDKYKVENLSPIATTIQDINKMVMQENSVIVNIENETEITTIINGKIHKIDKIENGMAGILKSVAEKENSLQKAYEICKNTTVYTKSSQNLKIEGNEYLDEIITALLEIIEKVKDNIITNGFEINNIYITGMGLIINNIDLLFQESFIDKKCEILVPYFVEKTNVKINIKDYIEVNSAIALALKGLDTKDEEMNFSDKGQGLQKLWAILTSDVGKKGILDSKPKKTKQKLTFQQVLNSDLDLIEIMLLRVVATFGLIIILYVTGTGILASQINEKIAETDRIIEEDKKQIAKIEEYNSMINNRTSLYEKMVQIVNDSSSKITQGYTSKNAIPNMLNKIMYNIPTGVQLLSIENPVDKNITITAQAEKYDQLGYFKAALEEEGILTDVTTTKGVKQGDLINVTITGKLPF